MGKESTMDYLVSEWVGFLVLLFVVYSPSFFAFIFNYALEFPSASQYKHIHTYIHTHRNKVTLLLLVFLSLGICFHNAYT